jgi:hypothetical protein
VAEDGKCRNFHRSAGSRPPLPDMPGTSSAATKTRPQSHFRTSTYLCSDVAVKKPSRFAQSPSCILVVDSDGYRSEESWKG